MPYAIIRKNQTIYKLATKAYRILHPSSPQFEFSVEITARCNLKCSFCTHEELISRGLRPEKVMEIDTFESVLKFIEAYPRPRDRCFTVNTTGLGEPFTQPKLFDMLSMIRHKFPMANLVFATNGILLNEHVAENLVTGLVDTICISLRFPDRERYFADTGTDCYDLVVSNIKQLFNARKNDKPIIHVQIFEPEDFPKAQKEWQPYFTVKGDKLYVIPRLDMTGFLHGTTPPVKRVCKSPKSGMTIDLDGNVYPCCEAIWIPFEKDLCLGNVVEGADSIHSSMLKFQEQQPKLKVCEFCPRIGI